MKCELFIYLLLLLSVIGHGQDPYYINYTIDDDLPINEVYDIDFDKKGLMWIAIDRGVCTFDGSLFKTYTTDNGLGDNVYFKIYRDWNNKLWYTGYNITVSTYQKGKFNWNKLNHSSEISATWIDEIRQI